MPYRSITGSRFSNGILVSPPPDLLLIVVLVKRFTLTNEFETGSTVRILRFARRKSSRQPRIVYVISNRFHLSNDLLTAGKVSTKPRKPSHLTQTNSNLIVYNCKKNATGYSGCRLKAFQFRTFNST